PGAYVYTNTRWLYSVQNVILEAYGSSFQSTGASHLGAFELNDVFNDWGDQYFPGTSVYANGYLINTATAGATSITTTTHSGPATVRSGVGESQWEADPAAGSGCEDPGGHYRAEL